MSRKGSLLVLAGLLLGVGAIGFLGFFVFTDEASDRAQRRGHDTRSADLSAPTGGRKGVVAQRVERGGRKGSDDLRSGLVEPGMRDAWDSEEFQNQVAKSSYRVLELIDQIQQSGESEYKARAEMLRELKSHIRQLGHRVDRPVRNQLLKMLDTIDERYRPLVGEVLGQLRGDVETAKLLVKRLKERPDNVRTRKAITGALANMQVQEVVPELLAMLGEAHDNEEWIVDAIGRLQSPEANLELLERLKEPTRPLTERKIIDVLGRSRDPKVLEAIKEDLPDAPPDRQVAYLQMIAMTRDPKHADAVLSLLDKNPEPQARKQAIRALGLMGDPDSGNRLMEIIQRGDPQDQVSATNALRNIRNPKTIDAMVENWESFDEKGRQSLLGAGTNMPNPGEKLVAIALNGVGDRDSRIRISSAIVLGNSRDPKVIEPLVTMLRNASRGSEQSTVLNALRRIGTKEAAQRALASLDVITDAKRRDSYRNQFTKILDRLPD